MLGIGIRIADLQALVAEVDRNSGLSDAAASSARAALVSVNLPIAPTLVMDRVADDLHTLRERLRTLLDTMLDISWNGPQSMGDLLLVDPSDLPIDWALGVIERRFATLDTAAKGGRTDDHVAGEDLAAWIRTAADDPALEAAIRRVGLEPLAWKILDTGGDADETPDDTFSRKDLRSVRSNGVEGVDLSDYLGAVTTVKDSIAVLDTAAHGGRGDGRFARSDLRASLRTGSLAPAPRKAAELLLDHDDLLPLIDDFAARHPHRAIRLTKALGTLAFRLKAYTNPTSFGAALLLDWKGTVSFPFRVAAGAAGATLGAGLTVGEGALAVIRVSDPTNSRTAQDEVRKMLRSIRYLIRHPDEAIDLVLDLEGLEDDPERWLGAWLPSLLAGGAGRAGGVPLRIEQALAVRLLNSNALTAMQVLSAAGERSAIDQLPQRLAAREAALRAALAARHIDLTNPIPSDPPIPTMHPRSRAAPAMHPRTGHARPDVQPETPTRKQEQDHE